MKAPKLMLLFLLLFSVTLVESTGSEIPTKEGISYLTGQDILPLETESEKWIRPRNETRILFDFSHEPEYNTTQLAGFWDYLNATYTVGNNTTPITKQALANVDLLILIGPTTNFTTGAGSEIEALTEFVQANGSLLIAPSLSNITNLAEFTQPFGFTFENNTVIDSTTNYDNSEVLVQVIEFEQIPLTTNVIEAGFQGRNIQVNSTWMEPWQPATLFQNTSVDLYPFMRGSSTTTTRETPTLTGSDVVLGVAMETSLDARLVGIGSAALFSSAFVTIEPQNATVDLQSDFGNTAKLLKNMVDWLAKRTGILTYSEFTVNVFENETRPEITNGAAITASVVIVDQNGAVVDRLTGEDTPLFGLQAFEEFSRNVTMSSDDNGTRFTGTIDTTSMHRGWVTPTVFVHTTGYSYLHIAQGDVYIRDPPSQFYKDPVGLIFLVSLFGEIGLFAATAVLTWQHLVKKRN